VPPSEDSSIGTYASHGCVRMHNWDAVDLFDRIVVGMPVTIQP
jgi:lipoprotein-anchoring transpeptidase ErfK/SrfK